MSHSNSISISRLAKASLHQRRSISIAVATGIAVATAVITGALLVGDSMRGSLRELTLQRLGDTDSIIAPGVFFHPEGILPEETSAALMYFPSGIAETRTAEQKTRRAGTVQILGCDDDFWNLDANILPSIEKLDDESVILNTTAATELGVTAGDLVTIRLPVEQAVPADSPLGRRDTQSEGIPRLRVIQIIPDKGLGRFAVTASQTAPKNVYLSRSLIGDILRRRGQANLLLSTAPVDLATLTPSLEDFGLSLRHIQRRFGSGDQTVTLVDYHSLTSDRLLLPDTVATAVAQELGDPSVQPISTYLANAIEKLDESGNVTASVPYSTLTAMDSSVSLPLDYTLPTSTDQSTGVPIVINSWAAEQLSAGVGSRLRIAYYEPEVENGQEIERYFDAIVTQVVPITKPSRPYRRRRDAIFEQAPTVYNDPDLTPLVPGVTDQESISDWDLPFPLQREISREDDAYWNNYRLTPKAFIPLAQGKHLFGSRFGDITGLRLNESATADVSVLKDRITRTLHRNLDKLGWNPIEIRKQQIEASRGTTPFDGLFLALSFFVIASAILLITMLMRLGLLARTREMGTLLATGWTRSGVRKLLMTENMMLATVGSIIGVALGMGYAAIVLHGLRSWWVGAVTVPFLEFHWTPLSLVVGAIVGWLIAMITSLLTIRSLVRLRPQTLLSGRDFDNPSHQPLVAKKNLLDRRIGKAALATILLALVAAAAGASSNGPAAAGGFVASGMLWLVSCLLMLDRRLRTPQRTAISTKTNLTTPRKQDVHYLTIGTLASRNATRNPLRSTLTIGLMASAAFLILSTTAFQLRPDDSGVGGFELLATSSQPFFDDLNEPDIRSETFGPDRIYFANSKIAAMRLKPGQDAGCNNLYRASQPTVLGIKAGFGKAAEMKDRFLWASHAKGKIAERSPWDLLHQSATGTQDDPIPVILDQNTAMWSLQMYKGIGEMVSFEYEANQPVYFQVVGLLVNSVLQGKLLIGEGNFERTFPAVNGYRFFMVDCEPSNTQNVSETLESRLGDIGMDVSNSAEVLSGMMAVQNTYLRTFQSLGGLGLLLGTIGLAISQVRSVLERRHELAVLQAIGFRRKKISTTVMTETATLLILGIGCGVVCATLAVLPHAWFAGIKPPMIEPLIWILAILVFGMLAGFVAVGYVSRLNLLDSLRSE